VTVRPFSLLWPVTALAILFASPANAQTTAAVPEANPGRPTVATPAALTPIGYLQFETGLSRAGTFAEFRNRAAYDLVTKLTVHPRLQMLVQVQPWARTDFGPASIDVAYGGASIGAQVLVVEASDARPDVAVSYLHGVSSGSASDLDIGSSNDSVGLFVSADRGGFHFDVNAIFNRQEGEDGGNLAQYGQAFCASHSIGPFTIAGEVWHFTQPSQSGHALGNLWALSYAARPNIVFDTGFNYGFTDTSTRWQFFGGVTYLLPYRLWPAKHP